MMESEVEQLGTISRRQHRFGTADTNGSNRTHSGMGSAGAGAGAGVTGGRVPERTGVGPDFSTSSVVDGPATCVADAGGGAVVVTLEQPDGGWLGSYSWFVIDGCGRQQFLLEAGCFRELPCCLYSTRSAPSTTHLLGLTTYRCRPEAKIKLVVDILHPLSPCHVVPLTPTQAVRTSAGTLRVGTPGHYRRLHCARARLRDSAARSACW
jgi:hypothetical protein